MSCGLGQSDGRLRHRGTDEVVGDGQSDGTGDTATETKLMVELDMASPAGWPVPTDVIDHSMVPKPRMGCLLSEFLGKQHPLRLCPIHPTDQQVNVAFAGERGPDSAASPNQHILETKFLEGGEEHEQGMQRLI